MLKGSKNASTLLNISLMVSFVVFQGPLLRRGRRPPARPPLLPLRLHRGRVPALARRHLPPLCGVRRHALCILVSNTIHAYSKVRNESLKSTLMGA